MTLNLPSVEALEADNEDLLQEELGALAVRTQAAVVRALAERLECLPCASGGVRAQLVVELSRLGCRVLETAAALAARAQREVQASVPAQ